MTDNNTNINDATESNDVGTNNNTEHVSRGTRSFKNSQTTWQKKNELKPPLPRSSRNDSFCRKYDKYYHSLYNEARKLSRILDKKAQNPIVNPKFLQAWDSFDFGSKDPVTFAIDKRNNWMWKEINRKAPFEVVFEKMKNQGYWLKSGLYKDENNIDYFELSIGFYRQ